MIDLQSFKNIKPADIVKYVKGIRKDVWIKIGIATAAVLILIVVFIWPAWITRLVIRGKMGDLQKQVKTTQGLLQKKPLLLKDKANIVKFNSEVKNRLYEEGETSLLLGSVSKLALESGVSVVSSTPKSFNGTFPPPFDSLYMAGVYDFTIEGGFHELADFVSKIENYGKVLRIQSFYLRDSDESPADKRLADISLIAVAKKKKME